MVIVSANWLPRAPEPFTDVTICGSALFMGILISTYWRFRGSLRLWVPLLILVTIDAICIRMFFEQVRKLGLWPLDFILVFELFATMLFLNWFLDVKRTHQDGGSPLRRSRHV